MHYTALKRLVPIQRQGIFIWKRSKKVNANHFSQCVAAMGVLGLTFANPIRNVHCQPDTSNNEQKDINDRKQGVESIIGQSIGDIPDSSNGDDAPIPITKFLLGIAVGSVGSMLIQGTAVLAIGAAIGVQTAYTMSFITFGLKDLNRTFKEKYNPKKSGEINWKLLESDILAYFNPNAKPDDLNEVWVELSKFQLWLKQNIYTAEFLLGVALGVAWI